MSNNCSKIWLHHSQVSIKVEEQPMIPKPKQDKEMRGQMVPTKDQIRRHLRWEGKKERKHNRMRKKNKRAREGPSVADMQILSSASCKIFMNIKNRNAYPLFVPLFSIFFL